MHSNTCKSLLLRQVKRRKIQVFLQLFLRQLTIRYLHWAFWRRLFGRGSSRKKLHRVCRHCTFCRRTSLGRTCKGGTWCSLHSFEGRLHCIHQWGTNCILCILRSLGTILSRSLGEKDWKHILRMVCIVGICRCIRSKVPLILQPCSIGLVCSRQMGCTWCNHGTWCILSKVGF